MLTHPDIGIQAVFSQLEGERDAALIQLSKIGGELTAARARIAELESAQVLPEAPAT